MSVTGESIRTKWKNLKDGFAKYKKNKNNYGKWVWGPYLHFLDGAAAMRIKIPPDAAPESPTSAEAREVSADLIATYNAEETSEEIDASNPASSSIQEFLSLRDPLSSRPSRKRQASDDEYADDKLSVQYNNIEPKDSIDLLFESYAKSLKQMKPRTQARVKIRLAQIFADAELEDLQSGSQSEANQMPLYSMLSTTNEENETYAASSAFENNIKRE